MAQIDRIAARRFKEQVIAYNEWKKDLAKGFHDKDEHALRHVLHLEERMKKLEERLERYNKFFIEMRDLTPPHHSIHDKIY